MGGALHRGQTMGARPQESRRAGSTGGGALTGIGFLHFIGETRDPVPGDNRPNGKGRVMKATLSRYPRHLIPGLTI